MSITERVHLSRTTESRDSTIVASGIKVVEPTIWPARFDSRYNSWKVDAEERTVEIEDEEDQTKLLTLKQGDLVRLCDRLERLAGSPNGSEQASRWADAIRVTGLKRNSLTLTQLIGFCLGPLAIDHSTSTPKDEFLTGQAYGVARYNSRDHHRFQNGWYHIVFNE